MKPLLPGYCPKPLEGIPGSSIHRIEMERLLEGIDCFGEPSQARKGKPEALPRLYCMRIRARSCPELFGCFCWLVLVEIDSAEVHMGVNVLGFEDQHE